MRIQTIVKSVYGKDLVYPACATAHRLAKLIGTKTFSHSNLCDIEALGYTIEQVTPQLNWKAA